MNLYPATVVALSARGRATPRQAQGKVCDTSVQQADISTSTSSML